MGMRNNVGRIHKIQLNPAHCTRMGISIQYHLPELSASRICNAGYSDSLSVYLNRSVKGLSEWGFTMNFKQLLELFVGGLMKH